MLSTYHFQGYMYDYHNIFSLQTRMEIKLTKKTREKKKPPTSIDTLFSIQKLYQKGYQYSHKRSAHMGHWTKMLRPQLGQQFPHFFFPN